MQNRAKFTPYFLIVLVISILILFFSKTSFFTPINSFFYYLFSPAQNLSYKLFINTTSIFSSNKYKTLQAENYSLTKKLVDQNKLIQDNRALMDQFQTQTPKSTTLISANVIGAPNFIPGVSVPETLVLERGEADGVRLGDSVIYKNNLVGKIYKLSKNFSSVMLITNSSSSFTVRTMQTNSLGVAKGQGGGEIILDNVLLSENLVKGDVVLTKGDANDSGIGLAPDLIIGKIEAINKNPSDLFQKAEIKTDINVATLTKVFILQN